jgi:hypothetical protein
LGYELSAKDDVESLIYVLVFFYKGKLPWQNVGLAGKERTFKIGMIKQQSEGLFNDMPSEFKEIYEYLKSLKFGEQVDYSLIE